MFNIEEELKKLPAKPGVYIMHDKTDEIIYVGKAISLKNRVRQYFQSGNRHSEKIRKMVSHIDHFEYIITDSEVEALVLECNLIKQNQPYYNILLKDDKHFPYIRIDMRQDFPRVEIVRADNMIQYDRLEPAVCVKIEYVKGLSGNNLMVLRQDDVQMILNQLMGQPLVVTPDFEFDELNISAVSEVMNQMMGASATALSDFLGIVVDISTPTPYIMDNIDLSEVQDFKDDEQVAAIYFDITIDGVIKSEFC